MMSIGFIRARTRKRTRTHGSWYGIDLHSPLEPCFFFFSRYASSKKNAQLQTDVVHVIMVAVIGAEVFLGNEYTSREAHTAAYPKL